MFKNLNKKNEGIVAITIIFGTSIFVLAITSVMLMMTLNELKMSQTGSTLDDTFYMAESGLNEALYRLIENPVPGNYSMTLENYSIDISVSNIPSEPYKRIIQSKATNSNGEVRIVQITANTSSFSFGFDYAVQSGNGGIYLNNNSLIIGDVHSNGSILPATGGAKGEIQGNAWSALDNKIDRMTVTGDAYANNIRRSDIKQHAYYQTIDSATKVNGSSCPNSYCHPGSPLPDAKQFPIDDDDINTWKNKIDSSGEPVLGETPSSCPVALSSGTYCITDNQTLGNQKIQADFYIGNGATLTLDGNIWITGKVIMDNNGTVVIDSSLGAGGVVIIADGTVDINNNYAISGSGDPKSFILVVSMSANIDVDTPAIYASNNSDSIVFAALHGMLRVKNNGTLNAAIAEIMYLDPNSIVTYNPNLSWFTIPNPSGNTVDVVVDTWQEL